MGSFTLPVPVMPFHKTDTPHHIHQNQSHIGHLCAKLKRGGILAVITTCKYSSWTEWINIQGVIGRVISKSSECKAQG